MTQKDYKILAAALASVRPPNTFDVLYVHWAQTCIAIENALEKDNPRFKRELFRDACLDGQVGLEREALGRLASGDSITEVETVELAQPLRQTYVDQDGQRHEVAIGKDGLPLSEDEAITREGVREMNARTLREDAGQSC
jgi:hypothetical protein